MNKINNLSNEQISELFNILKTRFEKNMLRHKSLKWSVIQEKLESNPDKLWSVNEMERTGGEPDVVLWDTNDDRIIFCDCSVESPKDRRSLCYDSEALEARKENKPIGSAIQMADDMGIEILDEEQYRKLQTLGNFDMKTSSWLKTPSDVRKNGGAIFGDYRYGRVFIYHNGVQSYYAARGFRGLLRV